MGLVAVCGVCRVCNFELVSWWFGWKCCYIVYFLCVYTLTWRFCLLLLLVVGTYCTVGCCLLCWVLVFGDLLIRFDLHFRLFWIGFVYVLWCGCWSCCFCVVVVISLAGVWLIVDLLCCDVFGFRWFMFGCCLCRFDVGWCWLIVLELLVSFSLDCGYLVDGCGLVGLVTFVVWVSWLVFACIFEFHCDLWFADLVVCVWFCCLFVFSFCNLFLFLFVLNFVCWLLVCLFVSEYVAYCLFVCIMFSLFTFVSFVLVSNC